MLEDPRADALARAIRTLAVAVWCLCALVLIQLAFYGWGFIQSFQSMRSTRQTTTTTMSSERPASLESRRAQTTNEKPFHDLPPEEMVARSSVILLTSYQDDGKRYKAIVGEIIKQDPDVTLYYSVGDEYPSLSFYKRDDMSCGDGQVVFMVGSPAEMRSSYGFTNGRIGGLGDMPLTTLREMVKRKKS